MPSFSKNTIGNLRLLLQKASATLDEDITRLPSGDWYHSQRTNFRAIACRDPVDAKRLVRTDGKAAEINVRATALEHREVVVALAGYDQTTTAIGRVVNANAFDVQASNAPATGFTFWINVPPSLERESELTKRSPTRIVPRL